tara:strand:- start:10174 stop:11145 length:972 start_codon:yes stop_codon:yes gene_type:complete
MNLAGKVVLVTGAGGSIGSQICENLLERKAAQIKCFDNSEYSLYRLSQKISNPEKCRFLLGDVRDKDRLERAVADSDIVIHAAALKHVKFCEFNPDEAFKTNVLGTQNVVDACRKQNVDHSILISTDKAARPLSVMGTTKSLAEKVFINAPERSKKNKTLFTVVRFGNVFGTAGSVIETFYNQIQLGSPITLTDVNISRYFISVKNAADLVLDCLDLTQGESETPIFILKMKKAKIKTVAEKMLKILRPKSKLSFDVIGLLPGEKFDEILVSDEELKFCKEDEKYLIITREMQKDKASLASSFMEDQEVEKMVFDWLNERRLI